MSVVLRGPSPNIETTTILPNPEFSDVESLKNRLTINRSMNNTVRTYKQSDLPQLLTLTFQLTRMKSLELRAFVLSYYGSTLKLIDHNLVAWTVKFDSNPFQFTAAGRAADVPGNEMSSVTLIFEGTKDG